MASSDPRPSKANAPSDPRPTGKPQANTSKRGDSPDERVQDSPTTDPGERTQEVTEPSPVIHTPGS